MQMRSGLIHILMALALSMAAMPCLAGRFVADSVKVDGHMRHWEMYLPDGLQTPTPTVPYPKTDTFIYLFLLSNPR